jgi:hypothetical protein
VIDIAVCRLQCSQSPSQYRRIGGGRAIPDQRASERFRRGTEAAEIGLVAQGTRGRIFE